MFFTGGIMVKVDLSGAAGFFTASGPDYALAEKEYKIKLYRNKSKIGE